MPLSNYSQWAEIAMRILKVAPREKQAICNRLIIDIASYTSSNYFAIARLLAQFMDESTTITRIERGKFELVTYSANITDYTAVLIYLLTAVNELTKSYASLQVQLWRKECLALNIPYKDRRSFGKHGRTEAVRDSFFAQALEALYFEYVEFFKNNKNNF